VLNGIDYFLLQLDRLMARSCKRHNVCTFVVRLQGTLDHESLQRQLAAHPAYRWINRLRLRHVPFKHAQWLVDKQAKLPALKSYPLAETQDLPHELLATALHIERQAPFKVDLLQFPEKSSLLIFTWHHALMDAHGGELFIRHLGVPGRSNPGFWEKPSELMLPFIEQARIARDMKRFLFETSKPPLLTLYREKTPRPVLRYRVLSLSKQQTHAIDERARQLGTGFLISLFYLAASAYAVARIQQQRGVALDDLLVPVPQDRRRRGAQEPLFGNRVSFLFYRIPAGVLLDLRQCTAALIEQMRDRISSKSPQHYLLMMDGLRRMPGLLYRFLLKSPTQGLMGSFFYSDTGDCLPNCDQLFGLPISSAIHYPPNVYPPGMTFVFSRFRGALQITCAYMEQVIEAREVEQLFRDLGFALLAEEGTDAV